VRQQNLFSSLEDFCDRVHPQNLHKRALENIIRAGSFDSLNYNRTSLLNSIDKIIRFNQDRHQEKNAQQANLFADANGSLPPLFPTIPHDTTPPPSLEDICNMEFDAFGFYFSAHPLDAYESILNNFRFTNSREINSNHSSFIHLAGKLEKHKTKQSRKQNHYALATLSDRTGKYEVIVPSSLYAKLPFSLKDAQKKLLYILASFEVSDDKTSIFAHSISFLSDHFNQNTQPLLITIDGNQPEQRSQCLQELKIFLQNQSPSQNHRVPVYITIQQNNHAPTSFNTSETIPLSLNTLQQVSAIKGVHALGFKKPPQ
jgi:DNA polymerase-3 subunit alpha